MDVFNQFGMILNHEHASPSKKLKLSLPSDAESDPEEIMNADFECTVKTENMPQPENHTVKQQDTVDTSSWKKLFVVCTDNDYVGYVTTADQFKNVKRAYEIATNSRFVSSITCSTLGKTGLTERRHQVKWPQPGKDVFNHPYYKLSIGRYICDHGPPEDHNRKQQRELQRMRGELRTKKRESRPSARINCRALIQLREIALFIEYQGIDDMTNGKRRILGKEINTKVKNGEVQTQTMILVTLPKLGEHSHEPTGSTKVLVKKQTSSNSPLTTHVLDTALGKPAENLKITLCKQSQEENWELISTRHTNSDGRCPPLLTKDKFLPGIYRLRFDTRSYFTQTQRKGFYPYADVVFEIENTADHYHVPLLLSPFGYSTYRGS